MIKFICKYEICFILLFYRTKQMTMFFGISAAIKMRYEFARAWQARTMAKSLILCSPNSNPNPKWIFGIWIWRLRCGIFGFCFLSFTQNERKMYKLRQLSLSQFFKLVFLSTEPCTLISLINVECTLTDFEKFHPPQKKIHPPGLLIS